VTDRLVLVPLSPRVAPGQLSWSVWELLRSGAPVCAGVVAHPQTDALAAAGIAVEVCDPADPAAFRARARVTGTAVWLGGGSGAPPGQESVADEQFAAALGRLVLREPDPPVLEVLPGSWDLPGARLLDAVAVMARLRSPGGCPWDAQQTHASLLPYLLEEAYEAYETIEDGDTPGLVEELGDLLLQVLFHARLGEEEAGAEAGAWSVDDVAVGLVDKLVGRHPHVFGDASVRDAEHVEARWEELKAAEKGRTSVTDGVPMAMASLALAAKLQRRASRLGVPAGVVAGGSADDADSGLGGRLWRTVAEPGGAESEAALRATARGFRNRLAAAERRARAQGRDPAALSEADWRQLWRPDVS
jgi:XTP/dITP diphosphohydrolase